MKPPRPNPQPSRPLSRGHSVQLTRARGTWRALGADGRSLFFYAEVPDTGGFPVGVIESQLTASHLHAYRVIDGTRYSVTAYGGTVEMDAARGYSQRSA